MPTGVAVDVVVVADPSVGLVELVGLVGLVAEEVVVGVGVPDPAGVLDELVLVPEPGIVVVADGVPTAPLLPLAGAVVGCVAVTVTGVEVLGLVTVVDCALCWLGVTLSVTGAAVLVAGAGACVVAVRFVEVGVLGVAPGSTVFAGNDVLGVLMPAGLAALTDGCVGAGVLCAGVLCAGVVAGAGVEAAFVARCA